MHLWIGFDIYVCGLFLMKFIILSLFLVPRNYDGNLHPFDTSREYIRALNAAKLERVFAKPFLGSLDGHRDIISSVTKHPQTNSLLYSGSCDGEVSEQHFLQLIFLTQVI